MICWSEAVFSGISNKTAEPGGFGCGKIDGIYTTDEGMGRVQSRHNIWRKIYFNSGVVTLQKSADITIFVPIGKAHKNANNSSLY